MIRWRPAPTVDPFRQMAEQAPIGMVPARPDGTVVFANRRWREITGIEHPTPIPLRGHRAERPPRRPARAGRSAYIESSRTVSRLRDRLRGSSVRTARSACVLAQGGPVPRRGRHGLRVTWAPWPTSPPWSSWRRPTPQRRAVPQPDRQGAAGPHRGRPRRDDHRGQPGLCRPGRPHARGARRHQRPGAGPSRRSVDRGRAGRPSCCDGRARPSSANGACSTPDGMPRLGVSSATTLERDADGHP